MQSLDTFLSSIPSLENSLENECDAIKAISRKTKLDYYKIRKINGNKQVIILFCILIHDSLCNIDYPKLAIYLYDIIKENDITCLKNIDTKIVYNSIDSALKDINMMYKLMEQL